MLKIDLIGKVGASELVLTILHVSSVEVLSRISQDIKACKHRSHKRDDGSKLREHLSPT